MSDAIFKILRCKCGKQEYHDTPLDDPPLCPRCRLPRSYSAKWYIKTYENGKRSIKAVATQKKRTASVLDHAEAMIVNRKFGMADGASAAYPLLSTAIADLYTERWSKNKSGTETEATANRLMGYIGDVRLNEIGAKQLKLLSTGLKEKGYCSTTENRYLQVLKTILKRADLSTRFIVLSREHNRITTYSEEEAKKLLSVIVPESFVKRRSNWLTMTDLVPFLRDTGCRLGEALKLTVGDCNTDTGSMLLLDTKSGYARTIYAKGTVKDILSRRLSEEGIKANSRIFPITKYQAASCWRWAKKQVGIDNEDANLHAWRHTSVTKMLEFGEDLEVVRLWHGHRSITTTLLYVHYRSEHLQKAAARMDAVNKQSTQQLIS